MIKIGWQINNNKKRSWEQTCSWAAAQKVQTFEIAANPGNQYINVDKTLKGEKDEILNPLKKYNVEIATLAYCVNNLHPNEKERKKLNDHMKKVIQSAQILGVPIVACFIGNCHGDYNQNMSAFEKYFIPLLQFAQDHSVKLAIENCHAGGQNIGYSPVLWDDMFKICQKHGLENLGLEFDPSHLAWQAQDYYKALDTFCGQQKVFCMHAKDTKFFPGERNWWRFVIPGLGTIDWTRIFKILKQHKFNGAVQIEHEDSDYQGKKYEDGIILGMRTLTNALNDA
jgi:sugar phosphate isomerase/epimerase